MTKTNQDAGTTKPVIHCRGCGSNIDEEDMPQDGTCPWCGGRHLTAFTTPRPLTGGTR